MFKITRIILDLQDGTTRIIKTVIYTDSIEEYKNQLTQPDVQQIRLLYEEYEIKN